ncbi:MAG: hypothetical protein AVDCRST_MAG37-1739, partial [uncultured Rubrobacteraceae bacterium]
ACKGCSCLSTSPSTSPARGTAGHHNALWRQKSTGVMRREL